MHYLFPHANSPCSQSSRRQIVPRDPTQKKRGACELLHKTTGGLGLNLQHGPEDLPATSRSATGRHRHRLCLDRGGCLGSLDRADLSHSDLIPRRDRGEPTTRPENGCRIPAKGSVRAELGHDPCESAGCHGQAECVVTIQTPPWPLWESGIRRLRAFTIPRRGALSPPDPRTH